MKKLACIVIFIFCSLAIYAEGLSIGFDAGYAFNNISTSTRWDNTEYPGGHGFDISFNVEYGFTDYFSIDSGLRYIAKSYRYHHFDPSGNSTLEIDDYMVMNHFIQIPLTLRFSYGNDSFRIFVGGGGFAGCWLFSQGFGKTMGFSPSEDVHEVAYEELGGRIIPLDNTDNRFQYGLIAELGMELDLQFARLLLTGRYECSLSSLVRDYQKNTVHRYNDTFSVTLGLMFPLGDKK